MSDESIADSVKRRRLNSNRSRTVEYVRSTRRYRRKKRIFHLPNEILSNIFLRLSFDDIACNVINVCKRFQEIGIHVMNATFCDIDKKITLIRATLFTSDYEPKPDSDARTYKILSILDFLHDQFNILKASIWRYSFFQPIVDEPNLAARAGLLLDSYDRMFNLINTAGRFTAVDIQDLKEKTNEYLLKFEKYQCYICKNDPYTTGCKIIDLLNCFLDIDQKVVVERCEDNVCTLQINYEVDRAWLTVLILSEECQSPDKSYTDIRFMFKRIRRLIRANNSIILDQMLRSCRIAFYSLTHDVYCGYGLICDRFYFYGIMSEGYMVHRLAEPNDDNDDDDDDNGNNPVLNWEDDDNNYLFQNIDNIQTRPKLQIEVHVNCPLHLAPFYILRRFNYCDDLDLLTRVKSIENNTKQLMSTTESVNSDCFDMTLIIGSNIAKENRLPHKYKYCMKQTTPELFYITSEDVSDFV